MFIFTKEFRGLFWTQFFGAFVDNFYKSFLLVWITFHLSEQSNIDPKLLITISSGLFIIPFFLFSTIAGELSAKFEKTKLIHKTKWFEVALVVLAIFSFWFHSIPMLLSVLFMLGTQSTFFGPMKYSILPELISSENLLKANGWIEMGTFLSILLGTLLGSLILSFENSFQIFAAIMLFATTAGLVFSYTIPSTTPENPNQPIHANFIYRIFSQMIEIKKDARMFWMIQMISWFWFLGIIILTIIPLIAKERLGKGEQTVSILLTSMSLCIGLGSIACHSVSKKIHPLKVSVISGFFVTLFLFVLATVHHLSGFIIALSIFSFFCGLYAVPLYTYLQKETSTFLKSHLIAMLNIFNSLWMVVGSIMLGVLLQQTTLSMVFVFLGFGSLIQNFVFYRKLKIFH